MHKTAIRIDDELAEEAKGYLGTSTLTDTVNEAMREYVNLQRRMAFLERMRTGKDMDLHLLDEARHAWR